MSGTILSRYGTWRIFAHIHQRLGVGHLLRRCNASEAGNSSESQKCGSLAGGGGGRNLSAVRASCGVKRLKYQAEAYFAAVSIDISSPSGLFARGMALFAWLNIEPIIGVKWQNCGGGRIAAYLRIVLRVRRP